MKKNKLAAVLSLITLVFLSNVQAKETTEDESINPFTEQGRENIWNKAKYNISETWNSDTYDLYIPFYAWHNRLTYDDEHIDKYNEEAWGLGIGKYRYDKDGDWHGLYAIAFKDSNSYLETMFGYATDIRSLSSGRASYSMEPSHFEQVPANVLKQVQEGAARKPARS